MQLLEAVIFISLWAFGLGQSKLEQPKISISMARDKSALIPCKVFSSTFGIDYIHWYRQKPGQSIEHLLYVVSTTPVRGKNNKFEASKNPPTSTSILKINFLEKEDEAVYFCACWTDIHSFYTVKLFGDGTKLVVTDRSLNSELFSPKPTIFQPAIAEINLHKAGTYLCLLEQFFPDVIKVYWKEKNGNAILESQQGNTMVTNDTYMKFSWLTVTEKSMDKEYKCIVKHENNPRGGDQEILFPSIKKGMCVCVCIYIYVPQREDIYIFLKQVAAINPAVKACLEDKEEQAKLIKLLLLDTLQLQLTNTSAYYTYLVLLLKSLVYFAIISSCLLRKTAVCGHGKSS
ncbi:PREDICTED: TCR gamma alternate reading frame protein [Miniopterus natalensis]|uniref:TCR gamma alternate reading frame protein n=1 Tax=Miniopterus natalensis TaxID=291302 RepID=UPI0007A72B7F|nr:PREDICTED: TCR gamma alternate reading frame protein [Miniopterus natalensis]